MIFFNLIVLLGLSTAWAQEKILFLDLNKGKTEIAAAARVAKAKGQELIVYPTGGKYFDMEEFKGILEKNTFNSLCLSGHNGGNVYSGENGSVNVAELISAVGSSSSHETIEGLYLLGCNGANKAKIFFWKEGLPNLKFLAGYDGTAPLSTNPNGVKYFEDALKKQSQISSAKNTETLKQLMLSLSSVNQFETAVYATCAPEKKEYLYLPRRSGKERFGEFNSKECVDKIHEFKTKYLPEVKKYWAGDLEPTTQNPSSGFLKDAYVFTRQNEHCFGDEELIGFDGDQLLFLRFNKAFNESYFEYYKEQLKAYLDELNQFTSNTAAFLKMIETEEKRVLAELEDFINNPAKYRPVIEGEKKKVQQQKKAMLEKDPAFARCMANPTASCASMEAKFQAYYQLEDHLFSLNGIEDQVKEKVIRLKERNYSSIAYYAKNENLPKLKKLLEKGISSPSQMTRKDVMELSHLRNEIPAFSDVVGVSGRTQFYELEEMSGYVFPFSWHERIAGRPVEPPLRVGSRTTRHFSQTMPKEYSSLALILDESL
jgi:hypothetical protein